MARGTKTGGGSRKGCRNKRTLRAEAYVRVFLDDPVVHANVLAQCQGTALALEWFKLFLPYAFGKPVESPPDGDSDTPRIITLQF